MCVFFPWTVILIVYIRLIISNCLCQQIEALKAEYTATDYRPHYERARQEVTNLRAQLDMFTGFKVEMRQAKSLQVSVYSCDYYSCIHDDWQYA